MVRDEVASGLYDNPSEVIGEALRLMEGQESGFDWLCTEAALGFEQLETGETVEVNREEFLQQMRQRHAR